MKRVLMLASVATMIDQFNMPNIELLQSMGYQVDVACNFIDGNACTEEKLEDFKSRLDQESIRYFQVDFSRKVSRIGKNWRAYRQVKQLLQNNQYEFLHCHTPIGSVIGRAAGKRAGTKVIYTAHGFHFYKGAPVINWLIYYPVEKFFSRWTDMLITLNQEDYQRAKDHFHMKRLEYIPGVGIDVEKFSKSNPLKKDKRAEMEIQDDAKLLFSVGELNTNKNHAVVIKALAKLDDLTVHYAIAGQGEARSRLLGLAEQLGISGRIHLLGYRTDVVDWYRTADVFIFPSYREGLSLSLMEAMASGLPCVVSRIRGNADLIKSGEGGYLCAPQDVNAFADAIGKLLADEDQCRKMGQKNQLSIQRYTCENVNEKMKNLYSLMS